MDYNADGREDLIAFHDQTNVWELFLSTPQADGQLALRSTRILIYRLIISKAWPLAILIAMA